MPPRAISPKSCKRAERSAGSGISGDDGRITGPGSVTESASRSRIGGILPNASPNEAKTLEEAGPNVIVISCNSEPSPSQSRLEQASRTEARRGIRRAVPLRNRGSNFAHPSPNLQGKDKMRHYDCVTDETEQVTADSWPGVGITPTP